MVSTSPENLSVLTLGVPEILKEEYRCIMDVKAIFEDTSASPMRATLKN